MRIFIIWTLFLLFQGNAEPNTNSIHHLRLSKRANVASTDKETLELYAAYAGATYNLLKSWTCAPECQHPGTEGTVVDHLWNIPLITSSGYIAHNPNKNIIVVAFRGSQSLGDWAQSFTAVPTLWPASIADSVVNTGFLTGYIVAKPLIIQNIADLAQKYPEYLILVTGHSLGGSRAAMLVADLALGYPNLKHRLQLYTYGQAKCGNKVFADLINGLGIPVVRVVNRGDIVPKLPIEESVYAHFGTEAWYDFNNDTVVCTTNDYSKCSEQLSPIFLNIEDHLTYPGL